MARRLGGLSVSGLVQAGIVVAAFAANTLLHLAPPQWSSPARVAEFAVLIPAVVIFVRLALRLTPEGGRGRIWYRVGVVLVGVSTWLLYAGWLGPSRFLLGDGLTTTDFTLYLSQATVAAEFGWHHEYDASAFMTVFRQLGIRHLDPRAPGYSLGPPIIPLIVYPFAFLPLAAAHVLWYAVNAAGLTVAMRLLWTRGHAGNSGLIGLLFLSPGVVFAFELGQMAVVMSIAVVVSWWLVRRGAEVWAGLVLVVLIAKPQLVFLLPFTLLAIGRWRVVAAWAAASLALLIAATVLITPSELFVLLRDIATAAQGAAHYEVPSSLTLGGWLPRFVVLPATAAVVVLAVAAARRQATLEHGFALGLLASLIATPYIHVYDLVLLFVAGGLLLRTALLEAEKVALMVSYVLVNVSALFELQSVLPVEIAWLAWLAFRSKPALAPSQQRPQSAEVPGTAV